MFKVKDKKTGEIVVVLDTTCDDLYGATNFLVWQNEGWRWRPTANYVPPNYEVKND